MYIQARYYLSFPPPPTKSPLNGVTSVLKLFLWCHETSGVCSGLNSSVFILHSWKIYSTKGARPLGDHCVCVLRCDCYSIRQCVICFWGCFLPPSSGDNWFPLRSADWCEAPYGPGEDSTAAHLSLSTWKWIMKKMVIYFLFKFAHSLKITDYTWRSNFTHTFPCTFMLWGWTVCM